MPYFDYKCEKCGNVVEYFWRKIFLPNNTTLCDRQGCYGTAYKQPSLVASTTVGKYGKGGGR
jgi:hypothetical protein